MNGLYSISSALIQMAYKKLKSFVYYDKTQLPLRDALTELEGSGVLEKTLTDLFNALTVEDTWDVYEAEILNTIRSRVYPKKLAPASSQGIIMNKEDEHLNIEKFQYFLEMGVAGHILGTLWVLTIGTMVDEQIYEHSYGNRLRKMLHREDGKVTFSPYLFEPYFSQYGSWRDRALKCAEDRLKGHQDALILTLDFKSFYYSIDLDKNKFDALCEEYLAASVGMDVRWISRIHQFVWHVIERYADVLEDKPLDQEVKVKKRNLLPIGFLPSNILSNWSLKGFDDDVIARWNPVYYGRYVDDIIIVDKIEKNSPLYQKAHQKQKAGLTFSSHDVIRYFLCDCGASRFNPKQCVKGLLKYPESIDQLLEEADGQTYKESLKEITYMVNEQILGQGNSEITVQNDKVKVFYFKDGATKALLTCFKTEIARNSSEFRMLPEMEKILNEENYSDIFALKRDDTINKLRGITDIELDRYSFSKFLGKYSKVGFLINDKKETNFERDLMEIFDGRTLLSNYPLWERTFEILVINDRLNNYQQLAEKILSVLATLQKQGESYTECVETLLAVLRSSLCRTYALIWSEKMDMVIQKLEEAAQKYAQALPSAIYNLNFQRIRQIRKYYLSSRMVNKYIIPVMVDAFLKGLIEQQGQSVRLCHLDSIMPLLNQKLSTVFDQGEIVYYPYIVTPQDISYTLVCQCISRSEHIPNDIELKAKIKEAYRACNYPDCRDCGAFDGDLSNIDATELAGDYATRVEGEKMDALRIAIGNAQLQEDDLIGALKGKPNRSYFRYSKTAHIIDEALRAKADMLVLPECYLPFEWLPTIARLCAQNQIAIIVGIEPVTAPRREATEPAAYNLTAVILPYRQGEYKYAHVAYHHKVHYAPDELKLMTDYHFKPLEGTHYHLFSWHDVWFSVYCCFELASIKDRSRFHTYTDMTIAVEWNRDVNYYSNVIESLCRDLHCYCIQVNSSIYGDSRIIQPSKSELKDIIKTKGGENSAVLVERVSIQKLRDFQYPLNPPDSKFKPLPPIANRKIMEARCQGKLWESIKRVDKAHL